MELEELNRQLASANEQLKTNDKIQKEFINVAAHELRTPLQPIISYCALALRDKVDKNEAMQIIDKHAHRLHKLTTDLLAVIRIEGGSFPYKREKININDLILDVINNAVAKKAKKNDNNSSIITIDDNNSNKKPEEKDNANKKGLLEGEWAAEGEEQDKVLIEVNLDRNVKEIYADKDRIFEVLSNVIDNALKFTKKGKIKIESHVMIQDQQEGDNNDDHNNNNNKIEIKVSDTGAGIPEDILPHLFGKFVAKNVIGKESRQGSGLGLFISKAIVKAHKGEITAHNNESGSGATVSIVLPTGGTNINSDSDGNCKC